MTPADTLPPKVEFSTFFNPSLITNPIKHFVLHSIGCMYYKYELWSLGLAVPSINFSLLWFFRAAVKRLKTLRHPSVLTYLHSVETDKSVLLATEPVEPLQEHLEQLLDRGPKRENYLAWGIFQVGITVNY